MHGFRDGFLPYVGGEVKEVFEDLKARVDPQLVFTHTGYDLHQDHRLACELTWNTFRNHLILEYEIPKVDGDLGRPNVFVPLTEAIVEEKLDAPRAALPEPGAASTGSTARRSSGLMRLRGLESVAPERFAEAFTCRKVVARMREVRAARARRRVPRRARAPRGRARVLRPDLVTRDEFAAHGLELESSSAASRATRPPARLRGMHFQSAPHEETKLVRCTRGAIFDVIVDLRPGSPTHAEVVRGRARRRARHRAVRPEGFRPRLPDARRRGRGALHDVRAVRCRGVDGGALGRSGVRDRVAGGGASARSATATGGGPTTTRTISRSTRRVEIVAADLVDPREQLVDLVERVDEPSVELVAAPAASIAIRRCGPLRVDDPAAARRPVSQRCAQPPTRPGSRVISVSVKPGATENALTPCFPERGGERLGQARRCRPCAPRSRSGTASGERRRSS